VTSSVLEGYAIKAEGAGRAIGIAMENWSSTTSEKDKILVLVNPTWYSPTSSYQASTLAATSDSTLNDILSEVYKLRDELVSLSDNFKDTLSTLGFTLTKDEATNKTPWY